ncbi:sugar phosphate isomerase/epimerase [Alkalibaculum bacchi]|uniref:sugar phosphate isomerase/epimerase family protein n=1 Tax=Alkalibaculum bacchi TaxID=645887 RepID=UPI0026F2D42B|nr:sugar phosphate isomerase/epimerase family protein [Alkalibaculum bacchi]
MISYSELIFLNDDVYENVIKLSKGGHQSIELMMDGASWDRYRGKKQELIKKLRDTGCHFSIHPPAWDTNLTAQIKELRGIAYKIHVDTIQFAAQIKASHVVVHPGFLGSPCFSKETAQKRAYDAVCSLAEFAKEHKVKLAFENVGYHGQSLYTQEEFTHALDEVDPVVSYLIDLGHAHINKWDLKSVIEKVAPRLCGLHIHDNNGQIDQHLPIGTGNIAWDEVFEAMKKLHKDECDFILEYAPGTDLKYLEEGKNRLKMLH